MTQKHSSPATDSLTERYRGYAGLPPFAGLETAADVLDKGLTVLESTGRLRRIRWALKRLHEIFVARIAAMPIYELKMAFSLHAFCCAEQMTASAERIREMRQPPYGLEVSPDRALDLLFDEIRSASNTPALVLGLYEVAVPSVLRAVRSLLAETNRLFDYPTGRLCRMMLLDLEEIQAYGQQAISCLAPAADRELLSDWLKLLERILTATGGLDGTLPATAEGVERMFSRVPFEYDGVPQRDSRFKDPYNMGVNAEELLFDPAVGPLPKSIMLYFKRMREIDVPEVLSSILSEKTGKPWDYYRDMTRQLWDEARHAMMGEVGFLSLGIDWTRVPLNFTWSLELNTKLTALERHAVLFTIEQGLMPKKNGKEYEWQVALATTNRLTELIQDFDWADEVLHARIGRQWLVPEFGSQQEAQAFGDAAWSRATADWALWREKGLTGHLNWWPEIYRTACEHWGIAPQPELLAYNATYEKTRADQKSIAVE